LARPAGRYSGLPTDDTIFARSKLTIKIRKAQNIGAGNLLRVEREGVMSHKELQKFKEAAAKIARENDTPEKAKAILIEIGYLNANGEVAEKFR
jgi:hypothetical protein